MAIRRLARAAAPSRSPHTASALSARLTPPGPAAGLFGACVAQAARLSGVAATAGASPSSLGAAVVAQQLAAAAHTAKSKAGNNDGGDKPGGSGEESQGGKAPTPPTGAPASSAIPRDVSADALRHASDERLTPAAVVEYLDQFIIGQRGAKRAVAVALRNRWRRQAVADPDMRADIAPKNILMIGPTGVGKTEVARRMAKLTDAPFVKVEATKYTEVGFKGKDVESIIEDLFAAAKHKARRRMEADRKPEAEAMAMDAMHSAVVSTHSSDEKLGVMSRDQFNKALAAGELDAVIVPVDVTAPTPAPAGPGGARGLPIPSGPDGSGQDALAGFLGALASGLGSAAAAPKQRLHRSVPEALQLATQEMLLKLVDVQALEALAKILTEECGVVFVDEIDKVVADIGAQTEDSQALGVQQDLLPLVEGSNVTLKDGTTIRTDNILFICSGAFHVVKPADMIAELQGRLPVRVELQALKEEEFREILRAPKFNLLAQQKALLATERIDLTFTDSAVDAIAKASASINSRTQNIGARRLFTVIERVLDDVSFNCDTYAGQAVRIDEERVTAATAELLQDVDLAKYLL